MKNEFPLRLLGEVRPVSRRGYHAWASGQRSRRETRDQDLCQKIIPAFADSRQSDGYPRMTRELRAQGERVSKARVARLMKSEGLQGRQLRSDRPPTTPSNHDGPIAPNRLAQREAIPACDQVWQTDITYLDPREHWRYLAVVIDSYSKRGLGWACLDSRETGLVIAALRMASGRRGGRWPAGLLLHSDRGGQYSSARFREELCAHGITASMSRRGNCSDNALAESFFSTRKIELVYRHERRNHSPARQPLFEWIEASYNRDRRHSSIGYISPVDCENQNNGLNPTLRHKSTIRG